MPQCSGISTLIFCSGESAFHSMGSHEGRCADWDALGNSQVLLKLKHMCAFEFKESAHGFPFICMFASAKQICRVKFSGKIGWCQKRARMAQKRIQSQMRPISWGQRRRWSQRTAWERDLIDLTALHRWVFVVVFVFLSSYLSFRLRIHLCIYNRDFRKGAQNGALVQDKTLCTQPSWWSISAITTS